MLSKEKIIDLLKGLIVTIASQKLTLDDGIASNKLINNCLVDHQVHASLNISVRFPMSDDCKGIQHHAMDVAG